MIKKIFRFIKIEHSIFSLPLVFTGAWLGNYQSFPNVNHLFLILIATLGARTFGISFNRIFDKKFDSMNPRTLNRALPSGEIKLFEALLIAIIGLFFFLLSCLCLGSLCLKFAPIVVIFLLVYSLMKRFTYFCHFGIGLCLALSSYCAFIAISGDIQFKFSIFMFAFFIFCWLSASDMIYSIDDFESDKKNGLFSFPVKLGIKKTLFISFNIQLFSVILLCFLIFLLNGGLISWIFYFITVMFFLIMYLPFIPFNVRFFPLSTLGSFFGCIAIVLA